IGDVAVGVQNGQADGFQHSQDEAAGDGAADHARAADHHHHEGLDRDRAADSGADTRNRHEKPANDSGEHGAERKSDHRVAVDLDTHQLGRHTVLGQSPHGPAGLAVLHEQYERHNEQDGDRADDDAVVGHDQRIGDEDAFDDLRHAALLLAEEQENDGVE